MIDAFEGTLEPYMVIREIFIQVPGWDERTSPNKNNNNNIYIYIYIYIDTLKDYYF